MIAQGPETASHRRNRRSAEDWAARLPDLRTQALRIAATVAMGSHGRRRSGPGDSFWQFRPYRPGDPSRSIDWRRSAQGDRHFVREQEWQAAESFWLWLDQSPSMQFSGARGRHTKLDRASVLLFAMASLLLRSGERVGLLCADRTRMIRSGPQALDHLCEMLPEQHGATGLPIAAELPRHATVLAFSDTWTPLDAWDRRLTQLARPGVRGHIVQVIDPVEARLTMRGRVRVEGLEGEAPVLLRRAEDLTDAYSARFAQHNERMKTICRRLGWRFSRHATDHPPLPLLLGLHQAISIDRRSVHA